MDLSKLNKPQVTWYTTVNYQEVVTVVLVLESALFPGGHHGVCTNI